MAGNGPRADHTFGGMDRRHERWIPAKRVEEGLSTVVAVWRPRAGALERGDLRTMTVEEILQPFGQEAGKGPSPRDMHLHSLPWLCDIMEGMGDSNSHYGIGIVI